MKIQVDLIYKISQITIRKIFFIFLYSFFSTFPLRCLRNIFFVDLLFIATLLFFFFTFFCVVFLFVNSPYCSLFFLRAFLREAHLRFSSEFFLENSFFFWEEKKTSFDSMKLFFGGRFYYLFFFQKFFWF